MRSATIKLIACIMVIVMLLLVTGMPVKANTNEENIILKKGEQEFLIYYKDICKQEFQFAISIDENAKEAELNFRNSVKESTYRRGIKCSIHRCNFIYKYFWRKKHFNCICLD